MVYFPKFGHISEIIIYFFVKARNFGITPVISAKILLSWYDQSQRCML